MKLKLLALAAACVLPAVVTPAAARPSYDDADGILAWTNDDQRSYRGRHGRRHRAAHTARRDWASFDQEGTSSRRRHGRRHRVARAYTSDWTDFDDDGSSYRARPGRRRSAYVGGSYAYSGGLGPRPRQWCGWWMRSQRGGGPELNLAWNWSRWGRATSPQVGAVVVWHHHVGEIVGRAGNGMWIVRSGNDGGAVRTRARSVAGAVFRI
jgi:hypothetical protein